MMGVWVNRLGLLLSFVGSLLMAISFGKPPGEIYQIHRGRKVSLAAFSYPWALYLGLGLLIVGFGLSFLETWL